MALWLSVPTISSSVQRAEVLQLLQHLVLDGLQLSRLVSQLQDVHEGFIVTARVPDLHTHTYSLQSATQCSCKLQFLSYFI